MLLKMPTDVIMHEIVKSKKDIESKIGQRLTSFCYPDGYFSEKLKVVVRNSGYRTAVSTIYGLNTKETSPYELRRIEVGNQPLCVFAMNIAGILGRIQLFKKKFINCFGLLDNLASSKYKRHKYKAKQNQNESI